MVKHNLDCPFLIAAAVKRDQYRSLPAQETSLKHPYPYHHR